MPHRKAGKDLSTFTYRNLPREGWRSSSSWARWKLQWSDLDRTRKSKDKEGDEDYYAAWDRQMEKLEKDTADIYKLFKARIEADPFDALFGRRILYPNRPTWWNSGRTRQDAGARQEKDDSRPRRNQAPDTDGQRQQDRDIAASQTGVASHERGPSPNATLNTGNGSNSQEFIFDPITMRKVPHKPTTNPAESPGPRDNADESFDIPVKRCIVSKPQNPTRTSAKSDAMAGSSTDTAPAAENRTKKVHEPRKEDWLTQEGFGIQKQRGSKIETNKNHISNTSPQGLHGEPTSARQSQEANSSTSSASLSYNQEENRTEDIDLLRASDVRAKSGLRSRQGREPESDRRTRREELETRFDENLRKFIESERALRDSAEWLASIKKDRKEAEARRAGEVHRAKHEREVSAYKAAMEAMQEQRSDPPTSSVDTGVGLPQQAEGDMASNVHEFASRERWYKRKAPHAAGLEEQNAIQVAKDRAFVKEIRGIYEETYGAIDTTHRQPGAAADHIDQQQPEESTASTSLLTEEKDLKDQSKEQEKIPVPTGPLSSQERIGTMVQQLLDDSKTMQKLLRSPGLSASAREELFHRNRSMRNASDAIAEALSSRSTIPWATPPIPGARVDGQPAVSNIQDLPNAQPQNVDMQRPLTVYSVLAYDPSTQQITTAEMSSPSDSPSERRLSLSEALSSLTEPAKFLPQLTALQSQGYEIVSSDTNILVLRKSHKATPATSAPLPVIDEKPVTAKRESRSRINPIDGTTTQTGNFASPTGFVNHDSPLPADELEGEEAEQNPSGNTVRRTEDVFSGPGGNRWKNRQYNDSGDATRRRARYRQGVRGKRTTRRMIWVGLWTAGCCYAVGVITELLRA